LDQSPGASRLFPEAWTIRNIHVGRAGTNIQDQFEKINVRVQRPASAEPKKSQQTAICRLTSTRGGDGVKSRESCGRSWSARAAPVRGGGACSITTMWSRTANMRSRLRRWPDRVSHAAVMVMRVYFEKPRTTVGWKGVIQRSGLGRFLSIIEKGISGARAVLYDRRARLPAGYRSARYIHRSTVSCSELHHMEASRCQHHESQTLGKWRAGLSTTVGFKKAPTRASPRRSALQSVRHPAHFLGIISRVDSRRVFRTAATRMALVLRGRRRGGSTRRVYIAVAGTELGLGPNCRPTVVSDIAATEIPNKIPSCSRGGENCIAPNSR